jgi:hypothetical protein
MEGKKFLQLLFKENDLFEELMFSSFGELMFLLQIELKDCHEKILILMK